MISLTRCLAMVMCLAASPIGAHEFWIDAQEYQVETGQNVTASLKNGQNFKGVDLAYFERRLVLFDRVDTNGRRAVEARAGDSPAFDKPVTEDGLLTLLYQSTTDTVNYAAWDKCLRALCKSADRCWLGSRYGRGARA